MEIKLYLQILRKHWWLIVLSILIATAVALGAALWVTPTYQTSARFVVSPSLTMDINQDEIVDRLAALDKRSIITTYAEVLNSERIFIDASRAINIIPNRLAAFSRSAIVLPESNILELTVSGPDPLLTADLTNAVGQQAIQYVQRLYTVYEIRVLDPAAIPGSPIKPQPARDIALAVGLGLIFGCVLAIVWEQYQTPLLSFFNRAVGKSSAQTYSRQSIEGYIEEWLAQHPDRDSTLSLIHFPELQSHRESIPRPALQRIIDGISNAIKQELWGKDIVGQWDQATFSVMLHDVTGKDALHVLKRVQARLSSPLSLMNNGDPLILTSQIGLAEMDRGENSATIMKKVEMALLQARKDGSGPLLYQDLD